MTTNLLNNLSNYSAPFGIRWKPAGEKGFTRVWKHVAMIFAVLMLSMANIGMAWGAVTYHSIVPNIDKTNYETYYLYSNGAAASSTNVVGTAFSSSKLTYTTACSSWVEGNPTGKDNSGSPGDFSAQGFYKTDAGDLKYNGTSMTFHVTNCVGVALLGKGNANTKPLQISVKEKDSSSEVGSVASTTGNSVMVLTYGTTLNASKKYDITITSVSGGNSYAYQIRFEAPDGGVTKPTFSPATGSSLVKSTGTVTLTSSGNTVYYKWSQTDNQYASGAGATLADAADGSDTSPVNATAPSTAGTWYLYAVAKNGSDYSDVVKATYTITNPTYTVSYNLNGGKYNGSDDAPTQAAVESGTNITMPVLAPTKADYAFVGWRCSVNSADYMPSASYTMTAANTTFTAQWTEACFEVPDARKNSDLAATITASMLKGNKIAGGTLTWENATDYTGNGTHGLILNEDGEQIVVTLNEGAFVAGSIITITTHGNSGTSTTCGVKVSGNNMTPATYSTESTGYRPFSQTYVVQAGDGIVGTNTFAIKRYNSNQVYIYSITVSGCGAPSCTAPNHVDISGNYHFFPGETLALTATAYSTAGTNDPIAAGDITGYQWQKYIGSDWENIVGETSATYTKANATTSDVGQYRCIVSTGATCSTTSDTFNAKCLQLYVYWDNKSDKCNLPFTKVDGTHATVNVSLENGSYTYYYKVTDGCGNWWGNDGTMTSSNCSGWNLNVNNHCGLTTTKAAAYTFNLTYNAGVDAFSMSVVYPSTVQPGGYNLYFANDERNWSNIHYRIGRSNWNSKAAMTLVPGTANLYQTTTIHYESDGGFEAWHIANNGGWSDGNSIYKTNTGDGNAITNATRFEGAPVPSTGLTVIPGSDHSTGGDAQNNNCEFYSYTSVPGMLTRNVSITAPSNGTISVAYTDVAGESQSFTSGNRDLAHTVIITPTATPAEGYTLSGLTVNGAAHTSGNTYTVTANTTIAATFSPASYTVTLNTNGGTINAGNVTSYTYGTGATLPTNVTKSGFTFGGWYDNSGLTGSAVTTISTTATGNKEYWAKWTAAASLTAISADVLYQAANMANITFTGSDQNFTGLSTNNLFKVYGTDGNAAKGKNENHNVADDISTKSFTSALYILSNSNTTSTSDPTQGAIEFITPSTPGILYLYLDANNSALTLKKQGTSTSTSLSGAAYKAMTVDANTHYFINGASSGKRGLYGIQYVSTYAVSITPTNVTKATGATGAGAAIKGKAYTATFTANTGYTLPSDATVSIGGTPQTKGSGYTWTISAGTATLTIPAANVTGAISITVTGVAAESYSITYHCNGAESGCPSNVAAAYTLPSPLPTGMTKDGYDFGGWFTDSECTVAAVAGAALTGNTDLYAKWTVHSASECITIAYFETTAHNNSSSKPDNAGKYIYGYTNSAKTEAYAYTITSSTGDNKGQGTGESDYLRMNYGTTVTIYADNTTTSGTPASFSNVTSVSVDFKMMKSSYYTSFDIYVGGTKIANNVSLEGAAQSTFTTFTYNGLEQLSGTVRIVNKGSGSSNYHFYVDNIQICTSSLTPCTTPTLPTATLNDQALCEGADIATWTATPTNASTITGKGESISYSWKKKGSETVLGTGATFDLGNSATESQAGTYVVTVTVSKAGYSSSSATSEVTLSVTDATEVTGITADKATVYPGNSVTLTATANVTPDSWQWYTCTSAEGAGAAIISGAESASYTIATAPAAGTYYYKAVATGSCGTAERVYTLTVTAASECQKYFWFVYAADATSNGVINNRDNFFGSSPKTGSSNSSTYKFTLDGTEYTATRNTGDNTFSISFTVPEGSTATLALNCKGSSSKPIYLIPTSGDPVLITDNSSNAAHVVENIAAGTYKVGAKTDASASWTLAGMAVQVCTASSCTDATPTIAAVNNTVCSGTKMRIDATGYETGAAFKWQKLNTSTSSWDDVAGATLDSLVIASVTASNAGSYRFIATKECARTSNTVTIAVPSAPDFGSTVPSSVSVMQTIALSINTVEATDAVKYRWYKSADGTWDAGDTEIGTNKELIKAYDGEAIGSPSYYIFCRAQNSCGITTSTAIAVNVTTYVEEDCATRGNESDAAFSFENSGAGQGSYESTACWTMNSNSKILVYYPPTGKYFKTAKVTIASSSESKASYNWSTNGGTDYTAVSLTVNSTLTERTIDLSAYGNVNAFQIGRNFDSKGSSGGTLYVSKICFEYTDACTATTVTPSTASVDYEMGDTWSSPTFTLTAAAVAAGGTLTYSSSNEDIASVDDEGAVTFNGDAGSVTITASYAGDGTYCASEGSYTITVSCPGGAPKVVPDGSVNMSGCNSSVTLQAKTQAGGDFADGTYQWFRNGTEIDGATSSSYTATQAGTYTVERTNETGCTTPSTNSAIVTSETTEPEVERLVPFQYYHVDKTYSDQMKMRHLFAVKNSGKLDGKSFKMYVSRSGGAATDVTSSDALVVWPSDDGHVDTVMVDLNKLSGKYSENDELVYTCKAIDCSGNVSETYKNTITMRVIGATPTLALICSGSSKAGGTRKTGELTVGGDFLTGYNVADLCQQTGNTSFDANTEWGLYTDLKANYIVTPVNGYAVFNKLNYEPFDILLLTDYPKASKSDAAKDVLDDMAALCDYRPMLSFKTHMVAKSPSKWAAKGFTTSPVVTKADGRLNLNIVCYAHPMFEHLKDGANVYRDADNSSELVYTMLTGEGYESSKGMQGFEIDAAENFVTIGLTHYNASIAKNSPDPGEASWTPGSEDRMLVTVAERQTNIEARFILFSINCGAQSKLTDKGEEVILACLEYLLDDDPLHVADCSFTFDNGAGAPHDAEWYKDPVNCPGCSGTKGDGLWSTEANWGPERINIPEEFTSARIAAPVTVDLEHAKAMELRIIDEGSIVIPAGKALDVKSTIRRMDGSEIYPTDVNDIHIGSGASGNGTLIFNNNSGDTKARVDMYSTAKADMVNMSAATSTWQYIGTPHNDVAIATYNYYDSWLYQYDTGSQDWTVIPNGGPLDPFRGYCVTHPAAPVVFDMVGTLVATTAQSITIPAGKYVVVANSWTAPIDINAIADDDMEGITDKSIYFFNTGSDTDGSGTSTVSATDDARWAAGTYVSVPIHSAPYTDGSDDHIPSMQGFYVVGGSSDGALHLDYDKHVRGQGRGSILSGRMHAPKRYAESNEPQVAKLYFRGQRYDDRVIILERADFTTGYDSGWDGEAWGGSDLSPQAYVIGGGRYDAVSAIPDYEGTVVAFRAGEDEAYTIDFIYDAENEPLYLFDTENNSYTQIVTGGAYHFTTSDKAAHSRFILTRHAPQIATGCENLDGGEGAKAKKLLIEDKMFIMANGLLYDATGKVVK